MYKCFKTKTPQLKMPRDSRAVFFTPEYYNWKAEGILGQCNFGAEGDDMLALRAAVWGCSEDPKIEKLSSSFPVISWGGEAKVVLRMEFRNLSNFMNSVVHEMSVMVQDRI